MTQEEKARAYDEALAHMVDCVPDEDGLVHVRPYEIFPELAESEVQRIRKWLITQLELKSDANNPHDLELMILKSIAWLDKAIKFLDEQLVNDKDEVTGEPFINFQNYGAFKETFISYFKRKMLESKRGQYNNEDLNILQRFSFYSYKDEPNVLYLSGLYVNEKCRNKGIGTKILEVADKVAKSLNCHAIRLKTKKGSNAERLYRTHGYNSLATEERDEIWLEKKGEQEESQVYETKEGEIITYSENKGYKVVEPKFNVGDWIVKNGTTNKPVQIVRYEERPDGTLVWFSNGTGTFIDFLCGYHLFTELSKEDEEEFKIAIETLHEAGQHSSAMWLKSLKQRWRNEL